MTDTSGIDMSVESEGGGGDATAATDNPWNDYVGSYVESVPELHRDAAREAALSAARHVEGLTTKKFQEAAEFRKQYEPFESLGLAERDPGIVEAYLNIGEQLEPGSERARDVLAQIAELHGLTIADSEADLSGEDDDADWDSDPSEDRLAALEQQLQQQQQERQNQEFQQRIETSLAQVEADNNGPLTDEQRSQLMTMATGLASTPGFAADSDPIASAWEAMKSWRSAAQKELVEHKKQEPGAADTGPSRPAAGLQKVSGSMADAEAEILALLQGPTP